MRTLMACLLVCTAAAVSLALPGSAAAAGGCTSRIVSFDVTAIELKERLTAHWAYGTGSIDTVQTASVSWRQARNTAAQRRAHHDYAFFNELTGACRVGDFRQGSITARAEGVDVHLDGSWSAEGSTGACGGDRTTTRGVSGQFVRRTRATAPPSGRIGVKWLIAGPTAMDCPFGTEEVRHLRGARFSYRAQSYTIAKRVLLGRGRTIRLPVHVRGTGTWYQGKLSATLTLDGTVTLTRYKDCSIRPGDTILGHPCSQP